MVTRISKGMIAPGAVGVGELDDEVSSHLGIDGLAQRVSELEETPAPASGGGFVYRQVFTEDTLWAKPAGVQPDDIIRIEMIGGGGGGGCGRNTKDVMLGGRGGNYIYAEFRSGDVPDQVQITIGKPGASIVRTTNGLTPGNPGTPTAFGSLISTNDNPKNLTLPILAWVEPSDVFFDVAVNAGGSGGDAGMPSGTTATSTTQALKSIRAGDGGRYALDSGTITTGRDGTAPGGGGGGAWANSGTVTSGAGARGELSLSIVR